MRNLNVKSTPFRNLSNILGFIFIVLFLSACQTGSKKSNLSTTDDVQTKPSYWVFKTNVYSSKKNKNISGYTHVTFMNPQLIRIDIYDPLGLINAGTLIYKEGQFEAIMPLERKYFFGVATAETMNRILKSPVEPSLFTNIIFQKKLSDKGWSCQTDPDGLVKDCSHRQSGIDILWKDKMTDKDGWVQVSHNEGEVDLKLKSSKFITQLPKTKFELQVPSSYEKFKVDTSGISRVN